MECAQDHIERLAHDLIGPGIRGIVLTGSHARGDATPYSDIDFDVFVADEAQRPAGPHLFYSGSTLVSVVRTSVAETRALLGAPAEAIFAVPGLRNARILHDPDGEVARLQEEARAFCWDTVQEAANCSAARRVVKDAEAIHKLLGVLHGGGEGGIAYMLAWLIRGATDAVAVQRGIMVPSVNQYFDLVQAAVGQGSAWTDAHRRALGMGQALTLQERAHATMSLYRETVSLLDAVLDGAQREVARGPLALITPLLDGAEPGAWPRVQSGGTKSK